MKTIYKSLMALAAALLLVPSAKAQGIHYDATSGFTFDKYVTSRNPDENGEYTLRIETFATGAVTVAKKSIPSDIVLVLDGSGSMTSSRMVHPTMKIRQGNSTNNTYSSTGAAVTTNTCIFVRYPDNDSGEFYRVQHGHQDTAGGTAYNDHWLFFETPNGTKYLYGTWSATAPDACVHDERPAVGAYPAESSVIFKGPTYRYPQRLEVLKEAVKNFIDLIQQNDEEEVQPYLEAGKTGNQISIVVFRGNDLPGDITNPFRTGDASNTTKALIGFTPVNTATNVTTLKNTVQSMASGGNTPHDSGMKIAQMLITDLESSMPAYVGSEEQRKKTVVLFTDGAPVAGSGTNANTIRRNAVNFGYDLKKNYHTKIFTIGTGPNSTDKTFLQRLSSNYPDAQMNASNAYIGLDTALPADKQIYYKDAAVDGMEDIFEAIAESVAGGGSSSFDNTPLMAVDMVSSSFELPANADASRVKVYTAQCLGTTGETFIDDNNKTHNVLAFAEPVLAGERNPVSYWVSTAVVDAEGNPVLDEFDMPKYDWEEVTKYIDANISISVDKTSNTVMVGGFEYEELWCGLDTEHANQEQYESTDYPDTYVQGYRGFKIIIEFPIVVKDGATGGPNVVTNLSSSGVYTTDDEGNIDQAIIKYPLPDLPIPINLVIEKHGLIPGESATFTILKKEVVPADPNNNPYVPFNRVTLTGTEDGSPAVERLLNLDPTYYYKIWEEGWAWSYTNQAQDLETAPSTETVTDNKFVINNEKTDTIIKHAEASKRNVMEKTTSSTTTP